MSRRDLDRLAVALAAVRSWPEDGPCAGVSVEFVDLDREHAEYAARRFCSRCRVVGRCYALGVALAPHPFRSVYGGHVFEPSSRAAMTAGVAS